MKPSNKKKTIHHIIMLRGYYIPPVEVQEEFLNQLMKGEKNHLLLIEIIHPHPSLIENKYFSIKKIQQKFALSAAQSYFPDSHLKGAREWYFGILNTYSRGGLSCSIFELKKMATELTQRYCKEIVTQANSQFLSSEEQAMLDACGGFSGTKVRNVQKGTFLKVGVPKKKDTQASFLKLDDLVKIGSFTDTSLQTAIERAFPAGNKQMQITMKSLDYCVLPTDTPTQFVLTIVVQFQLVTLTEPFPDAKQVFEYLAMFRDLKDPLNVAFIQKYTHRVKTVRTVKGAQINLLFDFKPPFKISRDTSEFKDFPSEPQTQVEATAKLALSDRWNQALKERLEKDQKKSIESKIGWILGSQNVVQGLGPQTVFELSGPHSYLPQAVLFKKELTDFACGICQVTGVQNRYYTVLECRHIFCPICVANLIDQTLCPSCKQELVVALEGKPSEFPAAGKMKKVDMRQLRHIVVERSIQEENEIEARAQIIARKIAKQQVQEALERAEQEKRELLREMEMEHTKNTYRVAEKMLQQQRKEFFKQMHYEEGDPSIDTFQVEEELKKELGIEDQEAEQFNSNIGSNLESQQINEYTCQKTGKSIADQAVDDLTGERDYYNYQGQDNRANNCPSKDKNMKDK